MNLAEKLRLSLEPFEGREIDEATVQEIHQHVQEFFGFYLGQLINMIKFEIIFADDVVLVKPGNQFTRNMMETKL